MYTDLHHLYPTDGYVNNRRSNYPFGETNGEKYKSANDFSKLGVCTFEGYSGTVFEPNDEYKGDFARTYFYMVTCYEEQIPTWYANYPDSKPTLDGKTYPGLSEWQLKMLMKWAKNDPVSEKEVNRNNAVYGIQENRNPFIDYPGLEEYIWGNKQHEAFSYDHYGTTGIKSTETADKPAVIYSPDGKRLAKKRRGVNIIRSKNGKAVKTL
jgi:endonuclease I